MTREDLARKIIEVIDAYGDKKLDMIATIEAICKQAIDEPISEDFEKEVEKMWAQESKCRDTDYTIAELTKQDYEDCAHHFANWQKQKMMKGAIDGKIYETQARSKRKATTTGFVSHLDYKVGDKVKIIIAKE